MSIRTLSLGLGTFALAASLGLTAVACEPAEMATNEYGLFRKVVAGSDKINVATALGGSEVAFPMELLQPYFVMCDAGDSWRITDQPAETVDEAMAGQTGFVAKSQVYEWTTREALNFSEIAFLEGRPEITAWNERDAVTSYMESGNIKLHPPSFKENLDSTLKRERSTRPYPVLDSEVLPFRGVAEKRVYNVLLPVALTPAAAITEISEEDVKTAQKVLSSATILVVFDATGSMGPFAADVAQTVSTALRTAPDEIREKSSMGFVFYRDAGDKEPLVAIPPLPVAEAANALREAAKYMSGGGDESEPVLDALYYALNIYDWGQSGKNIIIAVLNGDAKPQTTGTLDKEGRVPPGLDALKVAKDLYLEGINVITVQAGPKKGPNFDAVMNTLADETGGNFVEFGAGDTRARVADATYKLMEESAAAGIEKGEVALGKLEFDLKGFASIPLEVLDGAMLDRLRSAGVDFNIDPGTGGVLVREGYMLENLDLLEPQIQIEKETLQDLVNLYSAIAVIGADTDTMMQSVGEAIAAIAGEDFDDTATLEEIVSKKLGIQFRSDLLNFDLQFLEAMTPGERLKFAKRFQDAAENLSIYLEANLREFDSLPAVWMPIAALP